MAGFLITKVLSEETRGEELRRTIQRRRILCEDIVRRAADRRWGWVIQQRFNQNQGSVNEFFEKHQGVTVEQALSHLIDNFSLYSEPAWVHEKLMEAQEASEASRAASRLMPGLAGMRVNMGALSSGDHWARVREEEDRLDALRAEADLALDENGHLLDEIEVFNKNKETMGRMVLFLGAALLTCVILPLSLLPYSPLEISVGAISAYYSSVRGILLLLLVVVVGGGLVFLFQRSRSLIITDEDANSLQDFNSLMAFSEYFRNYVENLSVAESSEGGLAENTTSDSSRVIT